MSPISMWSFLVPALLLLLLLGILAARGFGVIKLEWLNLKWLGEMKKKKQTTDDPLERQALEAVIAHCEILNSKWILGESDLGVLNNTYRLVENIARSYHPNSSHPAEEARIRWVLQAFMDLKNRLLVLTAWKSIHAATQFRIRHILLLSRAWKLKKHWKELPAIRFLDRHGILPLFQWAFFIVRWLDLTFWSIKMMTYIIQDIVFKVFLVRWYLITGDLAMQVYSDREKAPEVRAEDLLQEFETIPESGKPVESGLPEAIQKIAAASRKDILFHSWSVEWEKVRGIYIRLVEDIARVHHPRSQQPLYEARLFDLLMGGVRFSEKIGAIQDFPFLNKILDLRISHVSMVRDTADFLMSSEVLAWVRKHKLTYIFKYALLLFKVVRRGNPALLFQDFALTLAGEASKRWLYLYLHDKITVESNRIYSGSP